MVFVQKSYFFLFIFLWIKQVGKDHFLILWIEKKWFLDQKIELLKSSKNDIFLRG